MSLFAKPLLLVHMGARLNLLSLKNGRKSRDTVPLRSYIFNLKLTLCDDGDVDVHVQHPRPEQCGAGESGPGVGGCQHLAPPQSRDSIRPTNIKKTD